MDHHHSPGKINSEELQTEFVRRTSRQAFDEYRREIIAKRTKKGSDSKSSEKKPGDGSPRSRSFWKLFVAFWRLLFGHQAKILYAMSLLTLSTILGLIPPLGTKLAIDSSLTTPPKPLPEFFLPWGQSLSRMQLLIAIAIAVIILALIKTVVQLIGRWSATKAVNQVQASIRRKVFKHVLLLPLHRIYSLKTGGATSLLREDAGGVADLIFSMLYNPWQAIVQLIGSLVILVLVDWRLLIAGLLLLPVVYFTHRTWIHSVRPLYRDVRNQRQLVDASTTETFGGIRVVRTFARQRTETQRFARGNHMLVRQQLMVWWRTRLVEIVWDVLIPLSSTGLLLYGGWQILQNQLTLGDLMMFLVYLTMLLGPIATLAGSAVQFQNNLAGLDRILDLLETLPEMADRDGAIRVSKSSVAGRIQLQHVGFQYPGNDTWVLRDISIDVSAGQTIALVGRSGAGKTTLCNLIARFFDPVEGQILVDHKDLRDIKLHSYRQLLGVVEQDVFLFDGSVTDNIAYGRRGASLHEVHDAARAAAADEFIVKLPRGYDTLIGERGVKLSGGQRQRLAIARAILADPKILILDEATSNLDSESERLIQTSLARLMKGRTSFVIAHRLSTIIHADQILVLQDGQIIQRGRHTELLEMEGPYSQMVRLQMDAGLPQLVD